MFMGSADAYASKKDLKKLEEKVERVLEMHELDDELTEAEKKLVKEVENDLRTNKKGAFISLDEL